jgi:hypothetical protein
MIMNIPNTSLSVIVTVICLSLVPPISVAASAHLTILYTINHDGHAAQFAWNDIPGAGGYGLYVGRVDLTIDHETKTINEYTHTVMP